MKLGRILGFTPFRDDERGTYYIELRVETSPSEESTIRLTLDDQKSFELSMSYWTTMGHVLDVLNDGVELLEKVVRNPELAEEVINQVMDVIESEIIEKTSRPPASNPFFNFPSSIR